MYQFEGLSLNIDRWGYSLPRVVSRLPEDEKLIWIEGCFCTGLFLSCENNWGTFDKIHTSFITAVYHQ